MWGFLKFVLGNFQTIVLTLLIVIVVLMMLWSCVPVILLMISKRLKSIDKTVKAIKKQMKES
ncbi:hypothetical protein ACFLZ2_02630 [Candidatus Margulisiibacteriota bacterium]